MIKTFVHNPGESNFSKILGINTTLNWVEKTFIDKDVKTTTDNYFNLQGSVDSKVGHLGKN